MYKKTTKWESTKSFFKNMFSGNEESIFLVVGLAVIIGIPLLVLWNPFDSDQDSANETPREVLQAVEIPNPDPNPNPGGGGNSGGGGGNSGGGGGGGNNGPAFGQPNARNDDNIVTRPNTPITIDILSNDEPRNNVPINRDSIEIFDRPDFGTVTINPDYTVTYTPNPDFPRSTEGPQDPFRYRICSENGACESATVNLSVIPIGRPLGNRDRATTIEDTEVSIDVLANDRPRDDFPIEVNTLTVSRQPTNGTAQVVNGQILYTPNPGYSGPDSFRYSVCANGNCDDDPVTITVVPNPFDSRTNQPPVANNDTSSTPGSTPVTIPVLSNDFDPDEDLIPANTEIISQPANGTATVNPSTGEITYTPNPGFTGTDILTYEITDSEGLTDTATVTITVTAPAVVNNPPVANDDQGTTPENVPVTLPVQNNDTDPDNNINPASITITTPPTHGTAIITNGNQLAYTPNPGYTGTDTLTYQIADTDGLTDTANVTLTVTPNPAPIANDDVSTTQSETPVTIPVLDNDISNNGLLNPGSVTVIDQPNNGTVTVNPDGTIQYTPNNGFSGQDTFVYEVSNNVPNPLSNSATVTITVNDSSNPPLATDDTATTQQNQPVEISILDNDIEPINGIDATDFADFVTQPTNGTLAFDTTTGKVTYTPNQGYSGTDSFTYEIENQDGTSVATVSLNVVAPGLPDAVDDFVTTSRDIPTTISVLSNDTTPTGQLNPSTLTVEIQPEHGVLTTNPDGTITYTPNNGFSGEDSFTYEIGNTEGGFDTATVYIEITVEPEPVAGDDTSVTSPETPIVIPILDNDTDPANSIQEDSVEIISEPENGTVTIKEDGTVEYIPNEGFTGTDTFVYKITNDSGNEDTANVTVNVVNEPTINPVTPTQNKGVTQKDGQLINPKTGQVLGATENLDDLARTGGPDEMVANLFVMLGVLLATGFFGSLYFAKTKKD